MPATDETPDHTSRLATLEARVTILEALLADHQAGALDRQRDIDTLRAQEQKNRWAQRLRRTP